jgi:hypothetical protein
MRQMTTWMQADVADWIECIGFAQYRENFVSNNISGSALTRLDVDSLKKDLGIGSFGHRTAIVNKILEFSIMPAPKPMQVTEQDFGTPISTAIASSGLSFISAIFQTLF